MPSIKLVVIALTLGNIWSGDLAGQARPKAKPRTPTVAVPKEGEPKEPTAAGTVPVGKQQASITSAGATRFFLYHVPLRSGIKPPGIVVAFHGGGGGMDNMYRERQDLIDAASRENMIAVFPNGQDTTDNRGRSAWKAVHCCGPIVTTGTSDVAFAKDIIRTLRQRFAIDSSRIHAVGFSNGAMLVHRIAAEAPDLFASVAVFSGTVGGQADSGSTVARVQPTGRVPILLIHGMKDDVVPFRGGWSSSDAGRRDLSFDESVSTWVTRNGCAAKPRERTEQASNGKPVRIQAFAGCTRGADVTAIAIADHVHHWPERSHGGVDGTAKAMEFFLAHPRR